MPAERRPRNDAAATTYRRLDAARIVDTACKLHARIRERFPTAGLASVAADVVVAARGTAEAARRIRRPSVSIRAGVVVLLSLVGSLLLLAAREVPLKATKLREGEYSEVITTTEATIASVVFLGAAVAFLLGLESRAKRARCLRYLHELRALAHVVDMHQLTKDPDRLLRRGPQTASSPKATLSAFELGRYLDYCSELEALIGKIAALFGQANLDPAVGQATDDVETLTTGLSRKIWQKIVLLDRVEARLAAERGSSQAARALPSAASPVAVSVPADTGPHDDDRARGAVPPSPGR